MCMYQQALKEGNAIWARVGPFRPAHCAFLNTALILVAGCLVSQMPSAWEKNIYVPSAWNIKTNADSSRLIDA